MLFVPLLALACRVHTPVGDWSRAPEADDGERWGGMRRIWMQSDGEMVAPYVAGTDVRVAAVLALLDDGWSVNQICFAHYRELTYADVRACVQYARRRPGECVAPSSGEAARPAPFPRSFWLESGVPLLMAAVVTALFWIYYRAPRAAPDPYPMSLVAGAGAGTPARRAEAFKLAGDVAYGSQRYPEAESWYRRAIAVDPRNAAATLDLGLTCFRQRRLDEAEKQYLQAANLDPKDPTAHFDLGILYSTQGRFTEARLQLVLAVALKPDDADFRYSLGKTCCDLRRYDEAIPQFELALHIDPDHRLATQSLQYARKRYAASPEAVTADR